jgi:hypothetical protein
MRVVRPSSLAYSKFRQHVLSCYPRGPARGIRPGNELHSQGVISRRAIRMCRVGSPSSRSGQRGVYTIARRPGEPASQEQLADAPVPFGPLEQAELESFPASDPPAWTGTTAGAPAKEPGPISKIGQTENEGGRSGRQRRGRAGANAARGHVRQS